MWPTPTSPTCSCCSATTSCMRSRATQSSSRRCRRSTGARRLFTVDVDAGGRHARRGRRGRTRRRRALAFDRGALAAAAQLLGVADRLIEIAADYAREREQFGKPIGSFQAVKHHLANALLALEFARPVTYRAAYLGRPRRTATTSTHVSMAKAYASDAAALAARTALQVHGAIGYTWEHDLHLWMKRAWALAAAWGDASWHRERVAHAVLGYILREALPMARIELPPGDGPEIVRALSMRPELAKAVATYDQAVWNSKLDWRLHELVRMRVAQINECAVCLAWRTPQAVEAGVTDDLLFNVRPLRRRRTATPPPRRWPSSLRSGSAPTRLGSTTTW